MVAARHQFAFLPARQDRSIGSHCFQFDAVDRPARGGDHHVVRIVGENHRGGAATLSQAIAGIDDLGTQFGAHRRDHRRIDGCPTRTDDAQRIQTGSARALDLQQRMEQGRRAWKERDSLCHGPLHQPVDIERRLGMDRRADQHCRQPASFVTRAMAHRPDQQKAIIGTKRGGPVPIEIGAHILPVRGYHTLRRTRGSGGENDIGHVIAR